MKICLVFLFAFSLFAFATEKYGVYDLQGKRISTFEAEPYELLKKTRQIKEKEPNKSLYVSSLKKGKGSKPSFRYRYKAETGAYIEVSRKETFFICPEKEIEGTWISEYSVALNPENCLSVQVPNLAGTFRILFLHNNGLTDSIQVLVEQSYIPMENYSHKMWVTDLDYKKVTYMGELLFGPWGSWEDIFNRHGHYESRNYSQSLIVDKTKFTMGDAMYYDKIGNAIISHFTLEKEEYKNKKLEESNLPLIRVSSYEAWRFANERSKKEGLDTAYIKIHTDIENAKKLILLENPDHRCKLCDILALDTLASGYRLPFEEEWMLLMHSGASTRYYWGDSNDSLAVSSYEWISPIGLKPVAQKLPNRFGLYDMAGIAYETVINDFYKDWWDLGVPCDSNLSPECTYMKQIGTERSYVTPSRKVCVIGTDKCTIYKSETRTKKVFYQSLRLLRKTPKLQKLEKF
jgi:hypothetical protein